MQVRVISSEHLGEFSTLKSLGTIDSLLTEVYAAQKIILYSLKVESLYECYSHAEYHQPFPSVSGRNSVIYLNICIHLSEVFPSAP